jgi:hypothetical protein
MTVYRLSKDAVLEVFKEGGMVLIVPERRLVELNQSAAAIVNLMDGQRTPEQIADEIYKNNDIHLNYPVTNITQDVLKLCVELNRTGVLELQPDQEENRI